MEKDIKKFNRRYLLYTFISYILILSIMSIIFFLMFIIEIEIVRKYIDYIVYTLGSILLYKRLIRKKYKEKVSYKRVIWFVTLAIIAIPIGFSLFAIIFVIIIIIGFILECTFTEVCGLLAL